MERQPISHEKTPDEMFEGEISAFMIKPDAHEMLLVEAMIEQIRHAGFDVVGRIETRVLEDRISSIYPDYVDHPQIFPAVKNLLTSGPSTLVFVSQNGIKKEYPEESVFQSMKRTKGRANTPGIRSKFIDVTEADLRERYGDGEELWNELVKNRIHAPDCEEELQGLLVATINESTMRGLAEDHPRLHQYLERRMKK